MLNKPLRIALSFPGCHRRGGVERIVLECANFLVHRGHDVHVFAVDFEDSGAYERHAVQVRRHPSWTFGSRYFNAATKAIDVTKFDVINTHGSVCPLDGVHWVQSVHAAWLERASSLRGRWTKRWLMQKLNPLHPVLLDLERRHFLDRRYKRVIAATEAVRIDLHRLYGVPHSDVDIVPNGFNPDEFNPQNRTLMSTLR